MRYIARELDLRGIRTSRGGFWEVTSLRAVLTHEKLYRTGCRVWAGIEGAQRWPIQLGREGAAGPAAGVVPVIADTATEDTAKSSE